MHYLNECVFDLIVNHFNDFFYFEKANVPEESKYPIIFNSNVFSLSFEAYIAFYHCTAEYTILEFICAEAKNNNIKEFKIDMFKIQDMGKGISKIIAVCNDYSENIPVALIYTSTIPVDFIINENKLVNLHSI